MTVSQSLTWLSAIPLSAVVSGAMTWACRPLLQRYALARPNARSSHRIPTPQGAGAGVIAATLLVAGLTAAEFLVPLPLELVGATLFIALVGMADDIKSINVLPRLLLQAAAVCAVLVAAPVNLRIVPACPLLIERSLLLLAGLWFVNLVNFMDGLDWMTVAEVVPITAAMTALGVMGDFPQPAALVAASLCGAVLGFAPFNRPVAKVFLGDVGSLPIGLLLGWCLLQLAWHQQVAAALLLPLYYLADTTITLFRRAWRGEPFWTAHRTHFYQQATDNGFGVPRIVAEVLALNVVLAALAFLSIYADSAAIDGLTVTTGAAAVAFLLYRFSRKR